MSILRWFSRKLSPATKASSVPPPSKPRSAGTPGENRPLLTPAQQEAQQGMSQRQRERAERRELLFIAVRDAMVSSGVLSTGYKFKVLSIDPRGKQFVVMVDLAREYAQDNNRLAQIEVQIARAARVRYSIGVTAVYWRINDQIQNPSQPSTRAAQIMPTPGTSAPRPSPTPSVMRAPASAPASAPMPLEPPSPVLGATPLPPGKHFEPIEADEVAAFKRALASSSAPSSRHAPLTGSAPLSTASAPLTPSPAAPRQPLLPPNPEAGFADTEMPPDTHHQQLSSTQYGDLE